jgi:hypothetical protein
MLVLQIVPLVQVVVPAAQRAPAASHVSTPLHATPSEQLRAVPLHVAAAVHVSFTTQNDPVLHDMPVRAVHAVVELDVLHVWHGFAGFVVPAA